MKKQSDHDFMTKFRLLNSQESSEEIVWSCSDSSDYENSYHKENLGKANKTVNRKRKRRKNTSKNISNLNLTFIDSPLEHKNEKKREKSPILQKVVLSPILIKSQQHFSPKLLSSPVLFCNSKNSRYNENKSNKSPILVTKRASPKVSPNVRKKLFTSINNIEVSTKKQITSGPVLKCVQQKSSCQFQNDDLKTNFNICDNYYKHIQQDIIQSSSIDQEPSENNNPSKYVQSTNDIRFNTGKENLNDTFISKRANVALLNKVKSYFDSNLSSENPSPQSISEYDTTPKNSSKTSEEIEIINSQTDTICNPQLLKVESKSLSDTLRSYDFQTEKAKKIRYKKDGLAYRLNVLLKKQKANTCLWQHERFLVANSNFILPNDEFTVFRIQNLTFKYGCYLLEVIDVMEKKYFVLINHLNMNSNNLEQCTVFKLYKPYKILDFNSHYQLIVNVSRFECTVPTR